MIRDAFHRPGPFVGSGGHYGPGPVTDAPLSEMSPPLNGACHTTLGLGRSRSLWPPRTDSRRPFTRPRCRPFRADTGSALGHRSLASAPFLRVRSAGLFEARRRLNDFCNAYDVRAQPRARDPRGTEAATPFRFARSASLPFYRARPTALRAAHVPRRLPPRCFPHLRGIGAEENFLRAPPSRRLWSCVKLTWRWTCTGRRTERRTCPRSAVARGPVLGCVRMARR